MRADTGTWRRRLKVLSLATMSVTVTLVAVGMWMQARPSGGDDPHHHREPDPVLGWRLEKGASYRNEGPSPPVDVRYNSAGFRDPEHDSRKRAGVFRVIVLGDSYLEGYSVELVDSFARQLETELRRYNLNAEVINLGVGGYGTLQEYLVFHHIGSLYQPDLVLLGFSFSNDLQDNDFELGSAFARSRGQNTRRRPFLDPSSREWTILQPDFEASRRLFEGAAKADQRPSRATGGTPSSRVLTALRGLANQIGLTSPPSGELDPVETGVVGPYLCTEPPAIRRSWVTTGRILERLNDEVSDLGGQLVVFSVPWIAEVNWRNAWLFGLRTAALGEACIDGARAHDRLAELLEPLAVPYLDLLPAFRSAAAEGAELFGDRDTHWNAAGHELASQKLQEFLAGGGLLRLMDRRPRRSLSSADAIHRGGF